MRAEIWEAFVSEVLLPDGWHTVDEAIDGQSTFAVVPYEYMSGKRRTYQGEWEPNSSEWGFQFMEDGWDLNGPMSSILAVKQRTPPE